MGGTVAEPKKLKWNEHPTEDDIKYRGKLSYRHFKIIGWALFVLRMLQPLLKLGISFDPTLAESFGAFLNIVDFIAPLSVVFLLMASFAQLLIEENYAKQMLIYGGAALGIALLFELLYHRYLVGVVDAFVGDRFMSLDICNWIFSMANPMGFVAFNIFLDLFLTTCVVFFLNYTPQKYFQGDKLKFFRALVAIPIIYEFVSMALKVMANSGDFALPITIFPFLTAKPPMMFFVFLVFVIYMKTRESRFCKAGRTHEEYVAYLDTNRSRFDFAKFTAIVCLIAGIIDFGIILFAIISEATAGPVSFSALTPEDKDLYILHLTYKYNNAGFGGAADLIIFAPIMLLFDYTRTYENKTIEMVIPLGAFIVIAFIYLEGILFGIGGIAPMVNSAIEPLVAELEPFLNDPAIQKSIEDGTFDYESFLFALMVGGDATNLEVNPSGTSSAAALTETTSAASATEGTSSSEDTPTEGASSEVKLAPAA